MRTDLGTGAPRDSPEMQSDISWTGGGISSYAGQQGAAGQCLEGCLSQALTDIPREKHKLTPVYLGATAGMRLLQWVDKNIGLVSLIHL